jgi:LacI family transcriptional regulator
MNLQDIAELAGVSTGTVDRVLHNRKGVSQKTKEKIQAIMDEYGYQPNLIARQLKNNKILKIGVLLPLLSSGCGYYCKLLEGMNAHVNLIPINKIENGKYNVSIDILNKICLALGVELKIE